jgi:ribosomal protein L40E
MSTTRPKLQLDEQSFQGLIAAAYTIQEHADLLKQVTKVGCKVAQKPEVEAPQVCRHCAAPLKEDESRCGQCGWEEFRPGERMQRNFASLWEMSQENGARQERPLQPSEESAHQLAGSGFAVLPEAANRSAETWAPHLDALQIETGSETDPPIEVEHTLLSIPLATTEDNWLTEASNRSVGLWSALLDLRQQLKHHRANLYLGLSVLVAVLALLWPTPAAPQRPRLDPWQRILVKLGIAEAPPPQIHYRGDPNIQVWVDPHTALYYCLGDEQYGKADGGRLTSQRDAQADQFEPANRAACN